MEVLERGALTSIGRASAFGALAILMLMLGLAGYPIISLKTGADAMMIGAVILAFKAGLADTTPYGRTELWSLLEPGQKPRRELAQPLVSKALKRVYVRFAGYYACAGFFCFGLAEVMELAMILAPA